METVSDDEEVANQCFGAKSGSLLHAVDWPNAGDGEEAVLYKVPTL